jgi:hypothetical protein
MSRSVRPRQFAELEELEPLLTETGSVHEKTRRLLRAGEPDEIGRVGLV